MKFTVLAVSFYYSLVFFKILLLCFRSGNEEKLMALLTPLNVNCHASDGRKVRTLTPLSMLTTAGLYKTEIFSELDAMF